MRQLPLMAGCCAPIPHACCSPLPCNPTLTVWFTHAIACASPPPPPLVSGTPLEPSKRRWVVWLSGAFLVSIPINFGLLAWGAWAVESGDGSCWSSDDKKMPGACAAGPVPLSVHRFVILYTPAWGAYFPHLTLTRCCNRPLARSLGLPVPRCSAATIFFGGLGVPVGQL